MAKVIEHGWVKPNDPRYREGTTIYIGGLSGRRRTKPPDTLPQSPPNNTGETNQLVDEKPDRRDK